VLIPYFDRPDLLRYTVASVLAQDDPAWRLTVVDDGPGTDGVADFLTALADPRVRYLHNPVNLGINRNFQRCLDLATEDVLVITGADDLLLPGYVGCVRAAYAGCGPDVAVVQLGVQVIDAAGRLREGLADRAKRLVFAPRLDGPRELGGETLATSLLRGNWLYFPALAWRRTAAQAVGFRDDLHVVQDLALVLDLVRAGHRLRVEPAVCFSYRRHDTSVSAWRAADGSRFAEERAFFRSEAGRSTTLGWTRAARAARRHVASRMNALSLLPAALAGRRGAAVRTLARHALRP